MKSAHRLALLLVTTPDLDTARRLATGLVEARLAACVNLVPGLESHYRWQGKVESAAEVLLVIKTAARLVPRLERWVLQEHPYDTPEILLLPLAAGTARYLAWLGQSVGTEPT
ncbi:MAG: divalent-cation tolerance protein CutA [Limisphaerales bacterium]